MVFMALKNYVLNGPSMVIADDDRDPWVSWRHHVERVGRGGVDLVALTPQPVYAPTDGVMDRRPGDGSAGNSCRFWHKQNAGWADVFSHLSSYAGRDMQEFRRGDLIAYTGATGGVTPHLHRHLLNPAGVRCNPWDFFTPTSDPAGSVPIKIVDALKDEDMKIVRVNGGTIALVGEFTGAAYGSVSGGSGFSIGVNTKAYGEVGGLTGDEVTTLINESNGRRGALIREIVAALPKPAVTSGGVAIDYALLAKAVNDDAARRMIG